MSNLTLVSTANLPTEYGLFRIAGFKNSSTAEEHVALFMGDINNGEPTLVRIHSECLTGDAFHSLKCDCGKQLEFALKSIAEAKRGVLIYHRAEGRGIGIVNKIRAYALQDDGLDTVEANLALGFKADERDFTVCAEMLHLLGVSQVKLMTNNPEKVEILNSEHVAVVERIPVIVGTNAYNEHYLATKSTKMGHWLK